MQPQWSEKNSAYSALMMKNRKKIRCFFEIVKISYVVYINFQGDLH